MLSENDEVISFYPGVAKNGNVELGRIVVHDRLKVESQVLPRYFNHSSFASLRRQLNYFSFTRMGKGRQRGATYCNEGVVELEDILRLKRRSSVGGGNSNNNGNREGSTTTASQPTLHPSITSSSQQVIHPNGDYSENHVRVKRSRYNNHGSSSKHTPTAIVSPRSSPVHQSVGGSSSSGSDSEQQITLDLTVPSTSTFHQDSLYHHQHHGNFNKRKWGSMSYSSQQIPHGDEDILAGCNALLSFSKGLHRSTTV